MPINVLATDCIFHPPPWHLTTTHTCNSSSPHHQRTHTHTHTPSVIGSIQKLKGLVHTKMKILSLITHPRAVLHP